MLEFALVLLLSNDVPNSSRLKEKSSCFTTVRAVDGQAKTPIFQTLQTIRFVTYKEKPAVDIVVHQRRVDGKMAMRDHFILNASNLRPYEFQSVRNGIEVAKLSYSDTKVEGFKISHDGKREEVSISLDKPVWEGNLWGVTFGAVPHQLGASYEIPFYQHDKGLGAFKFKVTGTEQVETPEGKIEAWVLDLTLDNNRTMQYLVSRKDGRELGLRGNGYANYLGGDCSAITASE